MSVRIVIVEDHPLMQKGMALTLENELGFEVCGMASSAEEAQELIREMQPDVAIIDISLPGMSGIELIRELRNRYEKLHMLVVSRYDEELFAERAVRAGAKGYIMKMHAGEQVIEAVTRIVNGGMYLSESISQKLLLGLSAGNESKTNSPYQKLSDRELNVFRMLGQGKATREIAAKMHISAKTVDTYKTRIQEKLHIPDRNSLLQAAVQWFREKEH